MAEGDRMTMYFKEAEHERLSESLCEALARAAHLEEALSRIAAPVRPDGTYNLGREACEQIAKEALDRS
jgi:hypothetical protein